VIIIQHGYSIIYYFYTLFRPQTCMDRGFTRVQYAVTGFIPWISELYYNQDLCDWFWVSSYIILHFRAPFNQINAFKHLWPTKRCLGSFTLALSVGYTSHPRPRPRPRPWPRPLPCPRRSRRLSDFVLLDRHIKCFCGDLVYKWVLG
jgi:hypothetical protein